MIRSRVRARSSVAQFCVLAAAAFAIAGPATADEKAGEAQPSVSSADLSGRWEGPSYFDTKASENCAGAGGSCLLRLDVVACGDGWCGIELGKEDRCGATALRLGKGKTEPGRGILRRQARAGQGYGTLCRARVSVRGRSDGKTFPRHHRRYRRRVPHVPALVPIPDDAGAVGRASLQAGYDRVARGLIESDRRRRATARVLCSRSFSSRPTVPNLAPSWGRGDAPHMIIIRIFLNADHGGRDRCRGRHCGAGLHEPFLVRSRDGAAAPSCLV